MAEIEPFRGIFYDVPAGELSAVLAPPYDVIPPDYQDDLYARDARNVVRLELNRNVGETAYSDAALQLRRFLDEGTLRRDPRPALYVLEQRFETPEGARLRLGLIARFRAVTAESGAILPHEHTRAAAKEDRFKLLAATRVNLSPIFLMVKDALGELAADLQAVAQGAPAVDVTDDGGVGQRLWRVTDAATLERFRARLHAARAYIADGHHRYATALRFAGTPGGTAFTLGYFTPLEAPGLCVLPYHRLLSAGPTLDQARARLAPYFELRDVRGTREAAAGAARASAAFAFGLVQPGAGGLLAELRPGALPLPADTPTCLRALDTYVLHQAVLGPLLGVPDEAVSYVHSLGEAEQAVGESRCKLAVLLRATPAQQIVDVAEAGQSMPAKSTFFYPKLPAGLVIHALDE